MTGGRRRYELNPERKRTRAKLAPASAQAAPAESRRPEVLPRDPRHWDVRLWAPADVALTQHDDEPRLTFIWEKPPSDWPGYPEARPPTDPPTPVDYGRESPPINECLDAFLQLAPREPMPAWRDANSGQREAFAEAARAVARTWGKLGLCAHGVPPDRPERRDVPGHRPPCSSPSPPAWEPLGAWWRFVREARSFINLAMAIQGQELGDPVDWAALDITVDIPGVLPPPPEPPSGVVWEEGAEDRGPSWEIKAFEGVEQWERSTFGAAAELATIRRAPPAREDDDPLAGFLAALAFSHRRALLDGWVSAWLVDAGLSLGAGRHADGSAFTGVKLPPFGGMFPVVALHLEASRVGAKLRRCDECTRVFAPKRRPREDRRIYCPSCTDGNASLAAKRAWWRKNGVEWRRKRSAGKRAPATTARPDQEGG